MKRYLRANGLSLAFGLLFLATLVGQAVSGHADFNDQQLVDGGRQIPFWTYVASTDFAVDVAENWQSEYLQFFLYIFATVWLVQLGSPESKKPAEIGTESDEKQLVGAYATADSPKWVRSGGWRTRVFSHSLCATMAVVFLLSWLAQSIAGQAAYNAEQLAQLTDPVTWAGYVASADFWNRTLQNWQSEFLALGSMAVFSVYLRQRGSPESKPVGAPHATTDSTG
ncbi:DUF6766 family protein [Actinophytocola oryzae]|uniref:Uncharacterized protein n=1 Tax=Actinophytocola oryzae TaxID=502181 RepID=A0A4R7W314_9PSEU|nr:DUF6766 family protein [Actinophytocola oryzae]TDV56545.1 hypothetical protein CLV71_102612 [Actinophytocola oryzae]